MSLRDYQQLAIDMIRAEFAKGFKRVLLVMPTGAGKTVVFCEMVKETVKRNKRATITVRGRKLVDQASKRLFREHTAHGVMMAKHWNYRPHHAVQVCSIDTVKSREILVPADLRIIDEAHLFNSDDDKEYLAKQDDVYTVAVTATPYVPKGLRHLGDVMVRPITMDQLIERGYLVSGKYYAPSEPDLRRVKVRKGDFVNDELEAAMVKGTLTGDIISHWKKLGQDRPTILFAVNIHHSKLLVERFKSEGISVEHCDADSPDGERDKVIQRLENGKTKIVCNVGIFCTGVDIPPLSCIIGARPTKSKNLFIQQYGRVTRPMYAPGFDIHSDQGRIAAIAASEKPYGIYLDHAGNIKRHGFPTFEPEVDLDGRITSDHTAMESKICRECFAVYRGKVCPGCGVAPAQPVPKQIIEGAGDLREITASQERDPAKAWMAILMEQRNGRKMGWVYHKLIEKMGREKCGHLLPDWFKATIGESVSLEENPFAASPFRGGV